MDEPIDPRDLKAAGYYTSELRNSSEPRWARLRAKITEMGIAPTDAAVGHLFPDDVQLEFGLLVARDGRCFKFELNFFRDEQDLPIRSPAEAVIGLWEELDEKQGTFTYSRAVRAGREFLQRESS
jgi:hypothetical protein